MAEKQANRVAVTINAFDWKSLTKFQLNVKLLLACTIRDYITAEQAIIHGADINCRRSDFMKPLHIAAEHGDVEMVRLLGKCRDVNPEVKTMHGLTPMHTAALLGHTQVIRELLRIGATTSCKDNLQRCALHYAALQKNIECARYLVQSGSLIHVYDVFQESPLHISVLKTKNLPMIKLLMGYRSRRSPFTSNDARYLLFEAILSARNDYDIQIIDMIIHYGGNIINLPDPIGWRTPLHAVAMTGYYDLAVYLIDRGANLEAKNRSRQTPMQVALNCKHFNIVRLIEDRSRLTETSGDSVEVL